MEENEISEELRQIAMDAFRHDELAEGTVERINQLADSICTDMVELPKDADGRPWHVGDRCIVNGETNGQRFARRGAITELQFCGGHVANVRVVLDGSGSFVRSNANRLDRLPKPRTVSEIAAEMAACAGASAAQIHEWADELEEAKGWLDQNGECSRIVSSVSTKTLGDWADRIRKPAEKEGER